MRQTRIRKAIDIVVFILCGLYVLTLAFENKSLKEEIEVHKEHIEDLEKKAEEKFLSEFREIERGYEVVKVKREAFKEILKAFDEMLENTKVID